MHRHVASPSHRPRSGLAGGARALGRRALLVALAMAALPVLAGCNAMFFQPNRVAYYYPHNFGLRSEEVFFPSTDGTQLTAWFLPAQGPPRGTVVFFHGNGANISNHLPIVRWLPAAGYAVFIFDYRGYGVSEGEPTRAGVIQDGVAAIRYVRGRGDVSAGSVVVFGQSLGAAVAISALAHAGTEGVRALVLEGAFGSYREAARTFMNGIWLSWPFQYPVAYLFFSDDHRAFDDLQAIAAVPLLMIHSQADRTVPIENGRRLFEAFPGADKTFWEVEGLPHIATFVHDESPWRGRLLRYLDERPAPPPLPPAPGPPPVLQDVPSAERNASGAGHGA